MSPEDLDHYIDIISSTVPAFNRQFLEEHYAMLNQASNSAPRDDYQEPHDELRKSEDELVGGENKTKVVYAEPSEMSELSHEDLSCDYDPYHLFTLDNGLAQDLYREFYQHEDQISHTG